MATYELNSSIDRFIENKTTDMQSAMNAMKLLINGWEPAVCIEHFDISYLNSEQTINPINQSEEDSKATPLAVFVGGVNVTVVIRDENANKYFVNKVIAIGCHLNAITDTPQEYWDAADNDINLRACLESIDQLCIGIMGNLSDATLVVRKSYAIGKAQTELVVKDWANIVIDTLKVMNGINKLG